MSRTSVVLCQRIRTQKTKSAVHRKQNSSRILQPFFPCQEQGPGLMKPLLATVLPMALIQPIHSSAPHTLCSLQSSFPCSSKLLGPKGHTDLLEMEEKAAIAHQHTSLQINLPVSSVTIDSGPTVARNGSCPGICIWIGGEHRDPSTQRNTAQPDTE